MIHWNSTIEGHPAAGKGILCKDLIRRKGVTHFSLGDALRLIKADKNHKDHELVSQTLDANGLIPWNILLPVVEDATAAAQGKAEIIVLDGIPRDSGQTTGMAHLLKGDSLVLHLYCDKKTPKERYSNRKREPEFDTADRFNTRYAKYATS